MFDGGGGGQCPQHVAQPQVRLDVVGLGGLDQRVDERAGTRAGLGVREEPCLPLMGASKNLGTSVIGKIGLS